MATANNASELILNLWRAALAHPEEDISADVFQKLIQDSANELRSWGCTEAGIDLFRQEMLRRLEAEPSTPRLQMFCELLRLELRGQA